MAFIDEMQLHGVAGRGGNGVVRWLHLKGKERGGPSGGDGGRGGDIVIEGVPEAIRASRAKFVFASNLMTRPGQTDDMSACDHVREVEKYVGQLPDCVIVNTGVVPPHLLEKYAAASQYPVRDDCQSLPCKVIRADLLSSDEVVKRKGDVLQRSLVRGDGEKFAELLVSLLY